MNLGKPARIALAIVSLVLVVLLITDRYPFPRPWGRIVTVICSLLIGLVARNLYAPRSPTDPVGAGSIFGRINFRELAKAGGCLVAMFAWLLIAMPLLDTPTGATAVLVPCFILLAAVLFFISRSY